MMGLYGWKLLNPRNIGPKMEDDMMTAARFFRPPTPLFWEQKKGVLGNQGGQVTSSRRWKVVIFGISGCLKVSALHAKIHEI